VNDYQGFDFGVQRSHFQIVECDSTFKFEGMSIKICFSASDMNILAELLVGIYREQCGLEVIPN